MKKAIFALLFSTVLSSHAWAIYAWDAKIETVHKDDQILKLRGGFDTQPPADFVPNKQMSIEGMEALAFSAVQYFLVGAPERKGGQFCGPSDSQYKSPNYRTQIKVTTKGTCPMNKGWVGAEYYCNEMTFEAVVTCKGGGY